MAALGPRLVVAGTRSGAGTTTVATGLMAALRRRGLRVAPAKVGPDFIDPSYHALATGRPPRNLDPWMCGIGVVPALAGRAAAGADLLVVEGVMGLFDGAADGTASSTADVAKALDAPVLLVVDCASTAQSVAAVVHGFATFDPAVRVAGVVCNGVASDSHEAMVRAALAPLGVPVLGVLRRGAVTPWRARHLGLVPVAEAAATVAGTLDPLADAVDAAVDLAAVVALARSAPARAVDAPPRPSTGPRARVAVAAGPAFSFTYTDNLEALEAAGAELVAFDPLVDAALPAGVGGLVAGGGFPEQHGAALAANGPMLASVRSFAARGGAVWAECGGLLWLARSLDGRAMAGLVPAEATLGDRGVLGYRAATTTTTSVLGPPGLALRGHEWHYSTCAPEGDALVLTGRHGTARGGWASPRLLASYLHLHLGAAPHLATAFAGAAAHAGVVAA
ncbi:MAG TPA: cobyrinate a,c-diamide synthase [Acidimicrobiales bacterium]|nr:cobyrinate a,c-diamide synthase [Acidimicrobiales bacterium]